jgi:hypothetical protein
MQKIRLFLLLLFVNYSATGLFAQLGFYQSSQIPVFESSEQLYHAWSGGLNSTQISSIDINQDGKNDLFVFDRTAQKFHVFLRQDAGVSMSFKESFDYSDDFPPMREWVLLRDFNCDGKEDIFTSTPGGIRVYRNTSSNGSVSFELETSLLRSLYDYGSNPFYTNVYVSNVDIPSIDDFDGDGDLDIHTFTLSGSTIEYHRNMQSENANCDSMQFALRNRCYGSIGEDAVSPVIYIGEEYVAGEFCSFNVPDPEVAPGGGEESLLDMQLKHPHAGSTLCMFDYDGNGKKDILIGDISSDNMQLVLIDENGAGQDSAIVLETQFPELDTPIDLRIFNAGYYVDVDNDAAGDLLISPANQFECADKESVWLYENTNSDDDADFNLVQEDFLQEYMIDMGTISHPHLADLNGDGLLDLVISNRGFYTDSGTYAPAIWRYNNTGSVSFPVYTLVDNDFAQLSLLDAGGYPYPTFGDLDGDLDIDMVVGTGEGTFYYYENTAGSGQEATFEAPTSTMTDAFGQEMDPGQQTTPQIYDLDQDGLMDIICGERNGNLNYYKNTGTLTEPAFELVNSMLGGFTTDINGTTIGYSVPTIFDNNGETNMIVGTEDGYMFHVINIDADLDADFLITDSTAFDIFAGRRSSPAVADVDSDGDYDIISGNYSGGLTLYMGGEFISSVAEESIADDIVLYPNPSVGEINLGIPTALKVEAIEVTDIGGRLVKRLPAQVRRMDVSDLDPGMYFCNLIVSGKRVSKTFIVR